MMKHKALYIAAAIATAAVFNACDEVSESDRYLPWTPTTSGHCVLVEEFSGQLCVNCPGASATLEGIQEIYGADTVIVVSIHAGNLALSQQQAQMMQLQGFLTDFGQQLYARHGITAPPSSIIDRNSGVIQGADNLLTPIVNSLGKQTSLQLSLAPAYDASTRTLTVDVLAQTSVDFQGNVNVWLTEDNIESYQMFPGYDVTDHVFYNIFRASATTIDGEPVSIPYGDEMQVIHTATFTLDELWQPANMHVVAFVEGSQGVEQATIAPVVE